MACGCTDICDCVVADSTTVSFSGSGTLADPYVAVVVSDPAGGLQNTLNGVAILIDPASTAPISTSAAGLLVDCCPILVADTNCIDLEVAIDGTISADLIIDPASPLAVTCGPAGLSVSGDGMESTTVSDTSSLNLTLTGADISGVVIVNPTDGLEILAGGVGIKVDPASPAPISTSAAGLYVACCAGGGVESTAVMDTNSVNLTLTGTTITADVILDPNGGLQTTALGIRRSDTGVFYPYGGVGAPPGHVLADGAAYNSVTDPTFAPLFLVIGTTYGGTGAANFNVPDVCDQIFVPPGVLIPQPWVIKK